MITSGLKMLIAAIIAAAGLFCLWACSSGSSPTDPYEGGPPAGAAVSARMSGFLGDGYFSVSPGEWSTFKHHDRSYFRWYGNACSFCVQLPVGYNDTAVSTPVTWAVSRGGYCSDDNYASVSIEEIATNAPDGYDKYLAVTGELTLTEFDNDNWIYVGHFEFRIGAFTLGDGYEYGGDHTFDTTFASGTFDSRIGGTMIVK